MNEAIRNLGQKPESKELVAEISNKAQVSYLNNDIQIKQEEPYSTFEKPKTSTFMQIESIGAIKNDLVSNTNMPYVSRGYQRVDPSQAQYQQPLFPNLHPLYHTTGLNHLNPGMMNQQLQMKGMPSATDLLSQARPSIWLPSTPNHYDRMPLENQIQLKYENNVSDDYRMSNMHRGNALNFSPNPNPNFISNPLQSTATSQLNHFTSGMFSRPQGLQNSLGIQPFTNLAMNAQTINPAIFQNNIRSTQGLLNPNLNDPNRLKFHLMSQRSRTENCLANPLYNFGMNSSDILDINKFNSTPLVGSTTSLDEEIESISTKPTLKTITGIQSRPLLNQLEDIRRGHEDIFGSRADLRWRTANSLDSFKSKILSTPDLSSHRNVGGMFKFNQPTHSYFDLNPRSRIDCIDEDSELSWKDMARLRANPAKEIRAQKVQRYRLKRQKWRDSHTINRIYTGRSTAASSKPRIKGRFVKTDEYEKYKTQNTIKELSSPSNTNDIDTQKTDGLKIEEEH